MVEDDPISMSLAKSMLSSMKYDVDGAENGQEAIHMVVNNLYQVVLMDIQMPVMDGIRATQEIRAREGSSRHVPIIALTANIMPGDRERYLACGMDNVITKPYRRAELADILQNF